MKMQRFLLFVLGVLVVLVPIFFNTATDSIFTFNKTSVFQLGVLLILALVFFTDNFDIRFIWKKYRTILLVLFSYFVVLMLATFFSESFFVSFFGADRQQGLLQYLFYFSFVLLSFGLITKKKYFLMLIYWIIGGALLVSVVGIFEKLGFNLLNYTVFDEGIASTLGHPSFLGAFIVMTIPLTIVYFFLAKSSLHRQITLVAILIQILALYFTQTRGAMVAFIGSVVFSGIVILIKYKKKRMLYSSLILIVLVVGIIIGTGYHKELVNFETGSGALRVLWAEQTIDAIGQKPLLGYGLEMQEDVLVRHYDPIQGVYSFYNLLTDRVHNEFLDIALTTGVVGLITYLVLIVYTFYRAIKYYLSSKDSSQSFIVLGLMSGLFAYLLQGMFSFSVTALCLYFWLFICLIFIIINYKDDASDVKNRKYGVGKLINIALGIVSVFVICFVVIRPVVADGHLKKINEIELDGRFAYYEFQDLHTTTLPLAANSAAEIPYRLFVAEMATNIASAISSEDQKEVLLQIAEKEIQSIKKRNPISFQSDPVYGRLLSEWGSIDGERYVLSDEAYLKATQNSPNYALLYYQWGLALEKRKEYQNALEKYSKAIELFADPNSFGIEEDVKKHLSLSIASVYMRMTEVESELGNSDNADIYHKKNQELIAPYLSL